MITSKEYKNLLKKAWTYSITDGSIIDKLVMMMMDYSDNELDMNDCYKFVDKKLNNQLSP